MSTETQAAASDTGQLNDVRYPLDKDARCPFHPAQELRDLQAEQRVAEATLPLGQKVHMFTRYDDQRALLGDPRVSADVSNPMHPNHVGGSITPLSFLFKDDPEHARLRRMLTSTFTVKRVQAMRPAVQRIVDHQIDQMLAGPNPVDFVQAFALPVPSLVISELLGVPYEDHEDFQKNSSTILRRTATPDERAAARGAIFDYLTTLMKSKKNDAHDDVLSMLGGRVTSGELTPNDAAMMGVLLLLAGHETTANMMALGTAVLLQHPDQLALLQAEDNHAIIPSAIEELLRYLTIVHDGLRRVATEDFELADTTVRAGEGVMAPIELANRDPEIFDNPDDLDLRRDARRHVAFGFGPHQCLGQPLARLELDIVYSTLYRRIPTLALATDLERLPFKNDAAIYGVHEMPVTW